MDTINSINRQLDRLREFFSEHIKSDYVYLDVPGHMNVGDHLIAMGAWELLKEAPFRCLAKSTIQSFNYKIPSDALILLHGGGNFGDLYPGANWFRNEIVKRFPHNKIIFLPQTITYKNLQLIGNDSTICAKHNNLHICARDADSFNILHEFFSANNLYLLPDTALGLYNMLKKKDSLTSERTLLIDRNDSERSGNPLVVADDVKDWIDILEEINIAPYISVYRALYRAGKNLHSSIIKRAHDRYLINRIHPYLLEHATDYFLRYDKVYTTRLHGYIFATMLHIPVEYIDTKYGKISGYIKTWFNNNDSI